MPHQALCEFWRRRHRSQDSPGAATKAATDALDKSGRSIRDALDRWARAVGVDDDEMSDLIARVDDCLGALKGELESVSQDASAEQGGDPILEQLEEILAGRVTSAPAPEERAECVAIVDAVTALGRGLNILTTAEGVETEEQFSLLRASGVDQVQGFLFSHPCTASEIEFDLAAAPAKGGKAA